MNLKYIGLGMMAAIGLCTALADTYLYDAAGALVSAFGSDGKAASFGMDPALNVSSSSTNQPVTVAPGGQALLTLPVVSQANPTSTGITATANLSALGGSATTAMNDSGIGGDAVAGDGIYSVTATVASGTPLGAQLVDVTFTDAQGRTWQGEISLDVETASAPGNSSDIPTLPEWGMILMAALLVLLAARNLPRRAMGCALAAALAFCAPVLKAELPYPVWENVPMDPSEMPAVAGNETAPPPEEPPSGGGISAMSLTVPQSLDDEILALASALGTGSATTGENAEAKAVRLFNWVRNNIDYQHYYGLRKGAALTFLEGSGNDFDQSILLADLLVAAGYPASDVKLRLRGQRVDYSNLMSWMGLAQEPYLGKTFQQAFGVPITQVFTDGHDQGVGDFVAKQAVFAAQFLSNRGSHWGTANGAAMWYPDFPGKANLLFDRMFVQLTVGGVTYDLDPSYKVYEKIVSTNDLLTASGYDRNALLTAAGGSGDGNSTSGLVQANVATQLAARTTQLLSQLNGPWASLTLNELVNGRRIVRQDITSLSEAFALPKVFYDAGTTFNSTSDAALASYKTTVRFQTPGIDYTIPSSDLEGRKITLTFSGNTVNLCLDDATTVATTTVTGTSLSLTITVTHPGSVGAKSETKTYRKADAFAYAILYGFTPSGRMLQKRYEQLRAYLDAGQPDTSREVRTELLNIMGLSWLYQTELCTQLIAQKNNVLSIAHHRFGRMAQEEGFYVDVGLQLSGSYPDNASPTDSTASARFDNVFHLGSVYASAMEHGIIEQMQPGSSAVSTVNILRKANCTAGNALYLARSSNWSTVSPILTAGGYSTAQVSEFNTLIGQGAQLFLPKNVGVTQGNWTGSGWIIRSSTQAGMIINGGYSGGYSTAPAPVVSPPIRASYTSSPAATYSAPSAPVYTPAPAPSVPRNYAIDPVDMGTGAYVYSSEDMATGVEREPRGLSFSRFYSSNEATRDSQNLGFGWSHNLYIHADARSAAESILGEGTPLTTAPFLVSMLAAADLYRSDATPKEWGVATLTVGWLVDGMKNNAVTVRIGKDAFQFIGKSDGTYTPPAGSTLALSKAVDGTYRLQERLGNTTEFDSTGKVTKIVDVDGKAMTFNYNANGTINYVEDCYARRFTFVYNGTHITGITDNSITPTRSVSFGYDTANWNLTSATDPELKVSYFDYVVAGDEGNTLATDHRIVRLRNHDLETITQNVWDSLGRVKKQLLHGLASKTFNLYYTGRDNFEVNPQGGTTHYFYDTRGRSTGKKDADGNTSFTGYDGQDRVVSRTSATGEVTGYAWDSANNLRRIDYPRGGGSTYMDYDSLNRLDLVTDPNTVQTKYQYFGSGNDAGKDRPQFVKAAFGTADESVTEYTYFPSGSAIGRVQTIKDGDSLTTQKTYDTYGQPDTTTLPGNFAINEDYSARGNLDAITDPNLKKTSYTYNKRRQVTNEVADQTGIAAATDTGIDNQARVATVTAPADNGGQRPQESRTYNPTDKVRLKKLNGVTVTDTAYDSRDWADTVKDAANRTTTLLHKANGAVKEAQQPGSRTSKFFYDGDNRVTLSSNPGSNSGTRNEGYVYDTTAGGLPRTVKTEADGRTVTSEFDRKGQLRFLKDRKGATFEFRYDALGRRTHVITPQNLATITSYKKSGRVASVSEPSGDSATFNYNATSGRLASVVYSGTGGGTVNYTSYDNNGNVLALNENGNNGISRTYDGLNRVTSYTFAGQTIGYRYYPSGKLAKLIYPGGTESGVGHVEYTYNADGRLNQVIDKLDSTSSPRTTTYTWRTDGRLQSVLRPNGTTRTISYDSVGRPEGITESAGLVWTIGYWPSDDIRTLDVTPAIPANQLSAVPNASMTFDSANQVATFNGASATHDLDGNMLTGPTPSGGTAVYSYDVRNRLTSMGTTAYTYNAENNRVGITSPTETTTLVVDPEGALSKVLMRTKNGITTRYVYGAGLQYEVNSTGQATYYHFDQTGNTAALTNQAGAIIERVVYSPYGTIRYRQSGFDTPFLYGGYFGVMTDANGLINMRARYYNPATMRFLNSDPARDGLNWYAYASNPISFSDPSGLDAWTSTMGGLRAAGGGFEAFVGYSLATASAGFGIGTSPTGIGAVAGAAGFVGGVAVGAHGVDTFQSGIRQMWTGQHVDSLTSTALQSAGMSPQAANLADAGISIVGSAGAGLATTGFRAATLASTASPQVANASIWTQIKYYEVGQTSFSSSVFNASYAKIPNTLDRGAQILSDYGSLGGVIRAGSRTAGVAENTLRFGPTPLANGAFGSVFTGSSFGGSRK